MKPLLFLDIDGVLNHQDAFEKRASGLIVAKSAEVLDPACVAELNRVISETGCWVVVSSTWRMLNTIVRLEQVLTNAGFEHHLLSATPVLGRARGDEIRAWLKRFPGFGPIAIVDDDSDMGDLLPRLVKTNFHRGGLTREIGDRRALLDWRSRG